MIKTSHSSRKYGLTVSYLSWLIKALPNNGSDTSKKVALPFRFPLPRVIYSCHYLCLDRPLGLASKHEDNVNTWLQISVAEWSTTSKTLLVSCFDFIGFHFVISVSWKLVQTLTNPRRPITTLNSVWCIPTCI